MEHDGVLSDEETQQLIATPHNERDKLLLAVLCETGCSVSEAAEIKVEDIGNAELRISGKKERKVPLGTELAQELALFSEKRKPDTKLFAGTHGTITTKRIRQLVQQYTQEAFGNAMNPKALRYAYFHNSIEKGTDLATLKAQLGLEAQRIGQLYAMYAHPATPTTYREFLDRA